ncbi:MAG: DUF1795 domain-containing protein [Oscillospiraceae bacterium]|nr:DUF1795 domain-containing protein [Oscillospiraceae bacterium]
MSQKTGAVMIAFLAILLLLAIYLGIAGKKKNRQQESSAAVTGTESTLPAIVPSSMPDGFTMQIPSGFTETGSQYIDRYYVRNDASIIVTGEKIIIPGEYLEDYVADVKKQYALTADEFQLVKEEPIRLADGLPCTILEFSYAIVGENARQDFRCLTAVMLKDNHSYIVTCKSRADTFGGYYQSFRDAVKSIRIADQSVTGTQTSETVPTASVVTVVP